MRVFTLLITISLFSCGKEPPPVAQDKLVEILVDVHIAEGLTDNHHPFQLRDSLEVLYLNQILEKHDLSQLEFESALAHLHGDPQLLDIVYKEVLQELANMSFRLDDEEARKRDEESNFRSRN